MSRLLTYKIRDLTAKIKLLLISVENHTVGNKKSKRFGYFLFFISFTNCCCFQRGKIFSIMSSRGFCIT